MDLGWEGQRIKQLRQKGATVMRLGKRNRILVFGPHGVEELNDVRMSAR